MKDRLSEQWSDYQLVRLLARGGLAEVYIGEHLRLKTQAVLKLWHRQLEHQDREGFFTETRPMADLEHPHILPILDFNVLEGIPFVVMSEAPYGNVCHEKGTRLQVLTVVHYVKHIALALQYAHDKGVIHQDIKPENVLRGPQKDLLLSDFGTTWTIAQRAQAHDLSEVVKTARYMAPEQFGGNPCPASDQYALGIMVYEWIAGELPFDGTFAELSVKHKNVPPSPLQEKVPTVPGAIEQVVMRALEKDPYDRFPSVQAFADALEETYRQELASSLRLPSNQLPQSQLRLPEKEENQPIGPPFSIPAPSKADLSPVDSSAARETQISGQQRSSKSHLSRRLLVVGSVGLVMAGGLLGWLSRLWFPTRSVGSRTVNSIASPTKGAPIYPPLGTTYSLYNRIHAPLFKITWSPDGTRLAAINGGELHIWNPTTGEPLSISSLGAFSGFKTAWSPDGNYLAIAGSLANSTGGQAGTSSFIPRVQIFALNIERSILTYGGHTNFIRDIEWSPDGKRLASSDDNNTVQVWESSSGRPILTYRGQPPEFKNPVEVLTWSPDGKYIASASRNDYNDGLIKVWNTRTGDTLLTYENPNNVDVGYVINSAAWSPDGKWIASQDVDISNEITNCSQRIDVWDPFTGATRLVYKNCGYPYSIAWSPNGKYIASAADKEVLVWDTITGRTLYTYRGHFDAVFTVAWSPDGTRVASGGKDQTAQVWQAV